MKKRSNIFVLCIVLLAYVFYPPSLGTADRNSFKGDKKFSLGGSRLADLPKVVRQKITEHMRRAEYQVSRSKKRLSSGKTSAYRAFNPNQNLTVCFTERGVHLIPNGRAEPAWHLEMTLSGYGYDGAMEPVHSVGLDAIEVSGNRVEYRRGVLTEWYVNDERGLEQGVTIREPPAGKSTSPLLVEWALSSSLVARAEQGRVAITFGKTDPILHYTGLMAWDAAGRSLPADLALRRTGPDDCVARISYVVDDTGASYPVTIDPVFTQAKKLRPAGSAEDWFGYSVSISGDKAVVGAPGDGENQARPISFTATRAGPTTGAK